MYGYSMRPPGSGLSPPPQLGHLQPPGGGGEGKPEREGAREHDPEAGALADRLAEITYLLSDLAAEEVTDLAVDAGGIGPVRLGAPVAELV